MQKVLHQSRAFYWVLVISAFHSLPGLSSVPLEQETMEVYRAGGGRGTEIGQERLKQGERAER